ncbi:MAG: hypothetical protein HKO77_01125 [Gemmatimonadetes bacterium]|nr:hypothetical protein [Gemmatimonadota bacterium]NNL29587.1 hypothetical protein [Gemmatimonadota bacterium]
MSVRSVVVVLVAAATVVVVGCVPDQPERMDSAGGAEGSLRRALPSRMDARDCADMFDRLVEARGRRGPTIRGAGSGGSSSGPLRVPVGEIGDWVVGTAEDEVVLVEDGRPASVCGPTGTPERPGPSVPPEGRVLFTDADLRTVVRGHEKGVAIYVWSPHMPLSVDGYSELVVAAEERGVTVVPLLFAESDPDFARREAARVGMPSPALRTVAAAELLLRDAQVHAPSVIVFRGREASPVMPGYRNAEGYGRWLDAALSPRDRPSDKAP